MYVNYDGAELTSVSRVFNYIPSQHHFYPAVMQRYSGCMIAMSSTRIVVSTPGLEDELWMQRFQPAGRALVDFTRLCNRLFILADPTPTRRSAELDTTTDM